MVNRQVTFTAVVVSCLISIAILSRVLLGSTWLDNFPNTSPASKSTAERPPKVVIIYASNGPGKFVQVADFEDKMLRNRNVYARKHGYQVIRVDMTDPEINPGNVGVWWIKPRAIRYAYERFPDADYFWWLDQDALIMNLNLSLHDNLFSKEAMKQALLEDSEFPVVDSSITGNEGYDKAITLYDYPDFNRLCLFGARDGPQINAGSLVFKRDPWTEMFLDIWADPIWETQKSRFTNKDQCVLHYLILQHPYIQARVGVVKIGVLNAYGRTDHNLHWQPGYMIFHWASCHDEVVCAAEFNNVWDGLVSEYPEIDIYTTELL